MSFMLLSLYLLIVHFGAETAKQGQPEVQPNNQHVCQKRSSK